MYFGKSGVCLTGRTIFVSWLTLAQLADLANLTQPFFVEADLGEGIKGLKGIPYDQIPVTLEDLQREYCKVSGLSYPIVGADYATSWMFFRARLLSVVVCADF